MSRAFACYDFDKDIDLALEQITDNEVEAAVLHEIGELRAGELLGEQWHHMLAAMPRSQAEIMARACRLWRFPEAQSDAIRFHHSPHDSDNGQLAYVIHTADILAKSAGHAVGAPCEITDIDPEILKGLKIDLKELDAIALAMLDDVKKIEEEVKEG